MADELDPKTNPNEEMGRSDDDVRDRVDEDEEFDDVDDDETDDEDEAEDVES